MSHCYGRQANYDLDLTIPNYVLLPYPGHRGIGQDEIVDMLRERDKFTVYISAYDARDKSLVNLHVLKYKGLCMLYTIAISSCKVSFGHVKC